MRLPDENKRRKIVAAAVKLFSEQLFHKVHLDQVAQAAGVGKGTVYIYFKSKEDLYYSSVYDGFAALVEKLGTDLAREPMKSRDKIRSVIEGLVELGKQYSQLFEVMRSVGVPDAASQWGQKRAELQRLVQQTIVDGVAAGELVDPHPEYTAAYLLAMVRGVMQQNARSIEASELAEHMINVLLRGIQKSS
jgi:AcrR family transcriptional regulator